MKKNGNSRSMECLPKDGLISFDRLADYLGIKKMTLEKSLKEREIPILSLSEWGKHRLVNI